ncbi:MAG: GPP34 family phosphoprotein [Gemmatimonadota bacterium]
MIGELRLHEALLLLALRDQKGGFGNASLLGNGLAGAILIELVLAGRIRIEKNKRSTVVRVVDERLTGEPIMDIWLSQMRSAKKEATVGTWLTRIAGTRKLADRIAERLWHSGLLRREARSFLVFDYTVFVLGYPSIKQKLVDRLRRLIRENNEPAAAESALVAMASRSGVLSAYFDRQERRMHRTRIQQMIKAEPVVRAVMEAMASVQAG